VKLRPWTLADFALVQEASLDSYIQRMIGLRPACGRRAAENWIGRTDSTSLVIQVGEEAVGEVGLQPDAFDYSAQLHYWVLGRMRGQGLAERAARLVCAQAGRLLLTAYVSERNRASLRILEKLGFQRGARVGHYAGYPGVRDTYSYFRLPPEEAQ
jgi:RimJ/RimL family protein N-acetyltransferase